MSAAPLRAALIGCGWIGSAVADDEKAQGIQSHAAAYAACEGTKLLGVCDSDAERANRAAARWGLSLGYTSTAEMLESTRPEIVSICTSNESHGALVREVLDSPGIRAIVVEKPLTLDAADAHSLVELAERRGVVLGINHMRRFTASHIRAHERVAAGEIGEILTVQGLYTKGVTHNGSHWFDLARWFVGEIVSLLAWEGPTDPHRADPSCHVRMKFAGGQSGCLLALDESKFAAFEIDVVGTQGRLRIVDSGMRFEWSTVGDSRFFSGYRNLIPGEVLEGNFHNVILAMIDNVVAAVRNGTRPNCSGEDGAAAVAIASAAVRSLKTKLEQTVGR